jgi:hypothetical protein
MNWRVTTDVSECGPAKNETCKCCDFTPWMGGKYCTNTSVPPVKCKHPNWHYDYPNTALFPNCQWWRRVLVFPLFLPSSIPSPPVLGVDVVVCLPCRYCLVRVCQAAQAEDLCVFVPSPVRFSFSFCVWLSDLRIVLEQPLPNLVLTPWGHVQTLYIHTPGRHPSLILAAACADFNDHPFPVAGRGAGGGQTSPEETAFRWQGLTSWLEKGLGYWWFDHNWSVRCCQCMAKHRVAWQAASVWIENGCLLLLQMYPQYIGKRLTTCCANQQRWLVGAFCDRHFSIPPPFAGGSFCPSGGFSAAGNSYNSGIWQGLDNAAWGSHIYFETVRQYNQIRQQSGDDWLSEPIALTKFGMAVRDERKPIVFGSSFSLCDHRSFAQTGSGYTRRRR